MSYCYSPLLPDLGCIRLLRLMPDGDEAAPIRCQLFDYSLHESAQRVHLYEAVSYVWGDCKRLLPISIANHRFNVTENLHAVLLRLRNRSFERIIWIDAICINQEDDKEKEHQILSMPKIYGQSNRVIVWLGEAADESDNALEALRKAGRGDYSQNDLLNQRSILRLLRRPWFQRVWVLQEVAAARHIQILCGSMAIDGFAFCLGLEALTRVHGIQSHAQSLIHPVTYLIKEAIFRPQYISSRSGRISLDICSLGELLDMYHTYKATKRHDKVYAMLGMASDSLDSAGLSPDYGAPWKDVLQRLVKFLLGEYISVDTWDHRDIAIIDSKGYVLGQVASVKSNGDDRENEIFIVEYTAEGLEQNESYEWTVPASAKSVQEGDLVCLLRGALKPTIVRTYKDHFAVIRIAASPPRMVRIETASTVQFRHNFLLIWNWETSQEKLQDREECQNVEEITGLEHVEGGLEPNLSRATRLWNVALILQDLGKYKETRDRLQEAIEGYERALGKEDSHLLTVMESLVIVYQKTGQLEKAEELISQVIQTKKQMLGEEHPDTLSSMVSLSVVYKIQGRSMEAERLEMMKCLLELRKGQITEEIVVQTAKSCDEDVMRLLLRRNEEEIRITEEVVKAAAKNWKSGEKVMRLLIDRKGEEIHITARAVVEIAAGFGEPLMALLLKQKGEDFPIMKLTMEDIIERCDEHTVALLLQRKAEEIQITREVIEAAARNKESGEEVMRLLIERKVGGIRITEGIVDAAAGNWESGEKVMRLLLEQKEEEVPIVQGVDIAAAWNRRSRGGLMMMLSQIEREDI